MRHLDPRMLVKLLLVVLFGTMLLSQINCGSAGSAGNGGGGSSSLTIAPPSASLLLGATQQFQAVFSGDSAAVTWEVDGVAGGNATVGTISAAGLYNAPTALPT